MPLNTAAPAGRPAVCAAASARRALTPHRRHNHRTPAHPPASNPPLLPSPHTPPSHRTTTHTASHTRRCAHTCCAHWSAEVIAAASGQRACGGAGPTAYASCPPLCTMVCAVMPTGVRGHQHITCRTRAASAPPLACLPSPSHPNSTHTTPTRSSAPGAPRRSPLLPWPRCSPAVARRRRPQRS